MYPNREPSLATWKWEPHFISRESVRRHVIAPDNWVCQNQVRVSINPVVTCPSPRQQHKISTWQGPGPPPASLHWVVWGASFVGPDGTLARNSYYYLSALLIDYREDKGGGWRLIHEDYGPPYFDCPLHYLRTSPPTNPVWRDIVRHYHLHPHLSRTALRKRFTHKKKEASNAQDDSC